MPSRAYRIEKQAVLVTEFVGQAADDDATLMMRQTCEMIERQAAHLLVDLRHLRSSSADLLKAMSRNGGLRALVNHPNVLGLVFVGADPLARFYIMLLAPRDVKLFASRDQAMHYLRQQPVLEVAHAALA